MINQMEKMGVRKNRIVLKIVGGAKMIGSIPENSPMDIGSRNVSAIKNAIAENKLTLVAEDLRGTTGRSMWLHIDTGVTNVRTIFKPMIEI